MSIGSLPNLFKSHLKRVDDLILGESLSQIDLIKDIYHHIFQPTGKKVRPLLTIAGFHFLHDRMVPIEDGNTEKLLFLAAAVECIHTATLLHDDVIDE